MQFNSIPFLLLLSAALILYYCLPGRRRWYVLLAASYLYYLAAGAEYLIFIVYTTAVSYVTALLLQRRADAENAELEANRDALTKEERKARRAKGKKQRFRILVGGLVLGFGMLAVLKYTAFVLSGVQFFVPSLRIPDLLLPLGISFYTFQSMGYLIDVYRGKAQAERNPLRFALFVSYFPQLLQGPISRFGDLAHQFFEERSFDGARFRAGLARTVWGYFKKMVVADTAMIVVQALVEQKLTGAYVVLLILLYSAVIYGDFTGGIDITIGISELFGIRLKENFDRPFSSRSVKEYWRRWHITMGTWFTDYVFYPLSVCAPMQRLSKWSRAHLGPALGKRIPVYIATIVTWFLTGLWHGAGWNFIVWGLLNCLCILVSQELQPLWLRWQAAAPRLSSSRIWGCWQAVRTFLLMGLIRSLDCYRNVPLTFRLWGSMFTDFNWGEMLGSLTKLGLTAAEWGVLAAGILVLFTASMLGKREPLRERLSRRPVLLCVCLTLGVIVILLFGSYGIGYDAGDFIYGQF